MSATGGMQEGEEPATRGWVAGSPMRVPMGAHGTREASLPG